MREELPNPRAVNDAAKEPGQTVKGAGFFRRHEWTLVGGLAVLAFLLGCHGYAQVMTFGPGGENTPWDIVYATFQLFIFEGETETVGWPPQLQFARALAPMVVLYTAAVAVWRHLRDEAALYGLLFRKRRFVVVCGVGETGFRLARDYCLNSDKRVVVIDSDEMNPFAAELENLGAIVVCGNAMDPLVLRKCQAIFAKEIFVCTSDDKANIAIAKNAERLTRQVSPRVARALEARARRHEAPVAGEPPHLGLRCFVCVDTPDIYEVFSVHSFFETNASRFSIRLFNRRETFARNIFRSCAPDLYYRPRDAADPPLHVLFVGFTAIVRELILQTALTAHYTDFRLPRVTVLCEPNDRDAVKVGRFLHRFPQLHETMDITFVHDDPMTVSGERWREMQADAPFSVVYVSLKIDVESILAARRLNRLRRLLEAPPLNFVVCLNQQTFLAEIIDDDFLPISADKSTLPEHEPIEYFETLDETICISVVVDELLDTLARTLHNAYLRSQTAQGVDAAANASVVNWSELPTMKKKANQHAAAHMDVKLRIADCVALSTEAALPAVPFPADADMLEALAQLEHRRWMADKHLAGYSYGPERDEDRMLHPDLVPWESLSESDKEKDRENIRQIPKLLALQEQKVCRLP